MRTSRNHDSGFTLVELLVAIGILAILAGLLLPALARAKEKAKVARVHAELYGLGLALEMYADDHDGQLPPVRANCNTDLAEHWCQFPVELAEQHYLPGGDQPGMAVNMADLFNPNHTYKYAAPGPYLLNGSPGGTFKLWVPSDFPLCSSTNGQWYSSPKEAPVRWVVWSLAPRPDSARSQDPHAPLASSSWYSHAGDGGVIARFATRDGLQVKCP
ncbi:MAG: prepilin-type N-terminal cleavage/methylation domain-containing protein [Candidatus Omnitrophica bacterium]|nr:prepilin-type N-terminal cleavage/methylation domain-containing protein [Candidatus Omnitrophota bacterium]